VVRLYLEARGRDLDAIVNFLSTRESPAWKIDVSLGPEAPIPNLLGQIRLQKLLVAHALNRAHLGREDEAERALHASWMLNGSLRDRPDVLSQLIAIAVARLQVGLARRISVDPASWLKRFADHDYRSSLLQAVEMESIAQLRQLPTGSSRWERASRVAFLELRRTFLVNLRDLPVVDGPVGNLDPPFLKHEFPGTLGVMAATLPQDNLANAVRRVDHLIIDTELTERILQARMLKASLGQWPTEIPNFNVSRMTGAHWIYSVSADGRLTVSLSRDLNWEGQPGLMLPLCYEST
jgi:hypothetical protein